MRGRGLDVMRPMFVCPMCQRAGEWTDGTVKKSGDQRDEYWCQTCGAQTPLAWCERVFEVVCVHCGCPRMISATALIDTTCPNCGGGFVTSAPESVRE